MMRTFSRRFGTTALAALLGAGGLSAGIAGPVSSPPGSFTVETQAGPITMPANIVEMLEENGYRLTEEGIRDSADDGLPSPVIRMPGMYPPRAEAAGFQAACAITMDITADGFTENVCAVCETSSRRADEDAFAESAVDAASQWLFTIGEPLANHSTTLEFAVRGGRRPPDPPEAISCNASQN